MSRDVARHREVERRMARRRKQQQHQECDLRTLARRLGVPFAERG